MFQQLAQKFREAAFDRWHLSLFLLLIISIQFNLIVLFSGSTPNEEKSAILTEESITVAGPEDDAEEEQEQEDIAQGSSVEEDIDPVINIEIQPGDSLYKVLVANGMSAQEVYHIVNKINKVQKVNLKIGQRIEIERQVLDDSIVTLKIKAIRIFDGSDIIHVNFNSNLGSYNVQVKPTPTELKYTYKEGEIDGSFFAAAAAAGISNSKIMEFTKLFSYLIDFQREMRSGDQFKVLYTVHKDEGGKVLQEGNILYAALSIKGKLYDIYKFQDKNGISGYFRGDGTSILKTLLRTPVTAARISSGYGLRKHPVLGYSRMHKGLDYAAPRGTPVFAAGDGVVMDIKNQRRGYGKYIVIKHNNKYSTLYAHLDRITAKLKKGVRVKQGDVIGRVGATGLATGPHLHYEVRLHNTQINPAKVSFPKIPPLKGVQFVSFQKVQDNVAKLIKEHKYVTVVQNSKEQNTSS